MDVAPSKILVHGEKLNSFRLFEENKDAPKKLSIFLSFESKSLKKKIAIDLNCSFFLNVVLTFDKMRKQFLNLQESTGFFENGSTITGSLSACLWPTNKWGKQLCKRIEITSGGARILIRGGPD